MRRSRARRPRRPAQPCPRRPIVSTTRVSSAAVEYMQDGWRIDPNLPIYREMSRSNPVVIDHERRRMWLFGQRCHHGAGGVVMAATGLTCLAAGRLGGTHVAALAVTGAALMAHDWHDRAVWFQPGPQQQQQA